MKMRPAVSGLPIGLCRPGGVGFFQTDKTRLVDADHAAGDDVRDGCLGAFGLCAHGARAHGRRVSGAGSVPVAAAQWVQRLIMAMRRLVAVFAKPVGTRTTVLVDPLRLCVLL